MKILVTGGAGYIGSHTCVELLENGYDVVIADNLSNSRYETVEKIAEIAGKKPFFYNADICKKEQIEEIFKEQSIDAVIHFAAYKSVGESTEKPIEYYKNNVGGLLQLVESMDKFGVKTIVFSSSATVYKESAEMPLRETAALGCANPYGWTKLMCEQILKDKADSDNNWSAVLLRYFNPIGAHESGIIGEEIKGKPNNLMPYITGVAAGKFEKLHIFGGDYNTPDGTGVRDYVHVSDVAEGHVAALLYAEEHSGAVAVNLGTGEGSSVFDILHAFERATGKKIPYVIDERRAGDIARYYACTVLAEELFGWRAKRNLEAMCLDSWRYTQNVFKNC